MSDIKCPFCQQELDCMGKYTDGSSKWLCNKCGLFGDKKLFDEIIRTRKALDVAVDALKYANKCIKGGCVNWETEIDKALEQITALKQKDK